MSLRIQTGHGITPGVGVGFKAGLREDRPEGLGDGRPPRGVPAPHLFGPIDRIRKVNAGRVRRRAGTENAVEEIAQAFQ